MSNPVRKVVIPAAGRGTRFLPATKSVPKELLPIGTKPCIQYVIEEAVASGIEEVILVSHPDKKALENYFQPDLKLEVHLSRQGKDVLVEEIRALSTMAEIRFVYQPDALGLGHAVLCARELVGQDDFAVILPDMLVKGAKPALSDLVAACHQADTWGLLLEPVPDEKVSQYGIVKLDGEFQKGLPKIVGAVEKPKIEQAPSRLSIMGRYIFPAAIFELLEKQKPGALHEIQLTDAINQLAEARPGVGRNCEGEIYDVGNPNGFFQAWQALIPLG